MKNLTSASVELTDELTDDELALVVGGRPRDHSRSSKVIDVQHGYTATDADF